MKTYVHFWSYLTQFFLEWEMFQIKIFREIQNTHFIFGNAFSKIVTFYEIILKKYCGAGQATDLSMAHVYCILDN